MKNFTYRQSGMRSAFSLRVALTAFFLIFLASGLVAQLNIPLTNCQNVAGVYTPLDTSGTVITTANFDDANSAAVNIGFSFSFNAQTFTQFVLNTNGFIRLGASPPSVPGLFYSSATSTTGGAFNSASTSDYNLICAFNHDLTGGTNPEYRVHTSGTAPNRICTIQYKNVRDKTVSPLEQFSSINFQILLYEGLNIIEIKYGSFVASANAEAFKSVAVGIKGSGNLAGQLVAVTKGSTTIYSAATFLNGNYTGNAFNIRNSVMPDAGRTLRFMPVKPYDLALMETYTLGKSPIPFGNPLTISAWIKNGGLNSMVATTCSLTITGANPFVNVQTVPALLAGDSTYVTFAAFSPTVSGVNSVEVTIPADDNTLNNTKTKVIETNLNSYSYAQGPQAAGGVGFTGATGDFVAKFTTSSNQSINQVNVQFASGGQPFQIGIWAAGTSGPGGLLHTTPVYTSTTGVYTVLINPPVSVPAGTFFVGVRQTGTTNVSFGYQSEVPIRSGHFYYTSPTGGTTWTDFAPGSPFRFMVEPKFALQTDVGITSASPATGTTLVAGHTYDLTAVVVNYGLTTQSSIPVYYRVNGGTPIGPVTTSTSIVQNSATPVTFTGTSHFAPATSGTYTLKFFTQLTNDLSTQNDTLTVIYPVIPAPSSALPYMQNFTAPLNWTAANVGSLWQYGTATGATGLTSDTAAFADFYSVTAGNSALFKSPAFNITSLAHPALQFDVAYRTKLMESDTLQVMVSTDGGLTFVPGVPPLYFRSTYSNPPLATTTPDTTDFFPSAAGNWRKETVSLEQFASATSLIIAFRAGSGNGNNCWIDNFNLFSGNLATVTTAAVTSIDVTTATSGGDVTAPGTLSVTARGVCWSTSPNPTILDPKTINGSGPGAFVSNITGLAPASTYYLRAYATNGIGTAYGNEITFTTLTPATVPTVTTSAVTSITHYGAVAGGNVTSDGGAAVSARGVCYSVLPNPTIADAFTNEGGGTGPFSSTLSGLDDNKLYYLRAYATNTIGTSYGIMINFTTLVDGIGESSGDEIRLWLTGNQLTMRSTQETEIQHLSLVDLTGRIVADYYSLLCPQTLTLTLPDLAAGTYVVRVATESGIFVQKIVVQ